MPQKAWYLPITYTWQYLRIYIHELVVRARLLAYVAQLVRALHRNCRAAGPIPIRDLWQPRSQALPSCWGKTLAGAGHVSHGNLIAQGGVGKVSNYMFPLSYFTLLLQGVSVLYRSTLRSYILAKFDLCLLLNYNNMLNRFYSNRQVRKSSNKNVWSYALQ